MDQEQVFQAIETVITRNIDPFIARGVLDQLKNYSRLEKSEQALKKDLGKSEETQKSLKEKYEARIKNLENSIKNQNEIIFNLQALKLNKDELTFEKQEFENLKLKSLLEMEKKKSEAIREIALAFANGSKNNCEICNNKVN